MAFRENMTVGTLKVLRSLNLEGILVGPQVFGGFGDHYFLHDDGTDGVGKGGTRQSPVATLDYALGLCTADNDDVIHIKPTHAETITGVGGITVDKAGVTIQGYGRYDSRPTFLMDGADTVTALFTADDVMIDNCKFNPGHADIAIFGHVSAKGVRISNCNFEEITTDENWVDVIHAGTADNDYDGLELVNNEINLTDDAHVTAIDLLKNCNDVKIIGNRITGDFNATPFAPIYMAVAEVPKNIMVIGNLIHNLHDGDAAVGISIACTSATGWMIGNHCYALDVAGHTPFLTGATGLYCSQNYFSYAGTDSGFEYPAIGTVA